jgi:hypothetical protein
VSRNKKRLIASITIFIVILLAGVMYYNNYRNNSSKNDIGIKDNNSKNITKTSEEKTAPKAQKLQKDNHSGKGERSNGNSTAAITGDNAVKLVRNRVKSDEPNASFTFDHIETKDNVEYYVVHAFDSMEDHGATTGWYYVDKSTGKVYEYDLVSNKLISIP